MSKTKGACMIHDCHAVYECGDYPHGCHDCLCNGCRCKVAEIRRGKPSEWVCPGKDYDGKCKGTISIGPGPEFYLSCDKCGWWAYPKSKKEEDRCQEQ
jgi:hypothetical protein